VVQFVWIPLVIMVVIMRNRGHIMTAFGAVNRYVRGDVYTPSLGQRIAASIGNFRDRVSDSFFSLRQRVSRLFESPQVYPVARARVSEDPVIPLEPRSFPRRAPVSRRIEPPMRRYSLRIAGRTGRMPQSGSGWFPKAAEAPV